MRANGQVVPHPPSDIRSVAQDVVLPPMVHLSVAKQVFPKNEIDIEMSNVDHLARFNETESVFLPNFSFISKEMQKVSKIILSSLFKKNKNFLVLFRFKLLSRLTKKDVVALGGISRKNLKMLKILDNHEFAGISYFE